MAKKSALYNIFRTNNDGTVVIAKRTLEDAKCYLRKLSENATKRGYEVIASTGRYSDRNLQVNVYGKEVFFTIKRA